MPFQSNEWLTLGEASQLLGVHPMTLRTWVDAGLVRAFRTPGGHRRFQLSELREFLDQRRGESTGRVLVAQPDQTLNDIRAQLGRSAIQQTDWYAHLSDEQRLRQRQLGQRLLGLLLQFVSRRNNALHFLEEAQAIAREYGAALALAGFSASELARAFLFFRGAIVNATYDPAGVAAQGDQDGVMLLQRINTFMDELLIATLEAFEQAHAGHSAPTTPAATKKGRQRHA